MNTFRKLSLTLFYGALLAVGALDAIEMRNEAALEAQIKHSEMPLMDKHLLAQDVEKNLDLAACIEVAIGGQEFENTTLDEASIAIPKDFITTHDGIYHFVSSVSLFGEYITLNDGLTWYVPYDSDRSKVGYFNMVGEFDPYLNTTFYYFTDNILILNGSYTRFVLLNQTTGDKIGVNLVEPLPGQLISTYTVYDIIGDLVFLNDGSTWNISLSDRNQLSNWCVGDSVTIGLNDGLFACLNRNILINVRTQKYIKGNCIR